MSKDELHDFLERHQQLFNVIHEKLKEDIANLHDCYKHGFNDGYDKALEDVKEAVAVLGVEEEKNKGVGEHEK